MKRVISLILTLAIVLFCTPVFADTEINTEPIIPEPISVYITVSDITDIDNPFNTPIERTRLDVEWIDLNDISNEIVGEGALNNCNLASGAKYTYLHAIIALHKMIYGTPNGRFYMNSEGITTYFLGKVGASIMYKNGDDIFDLPQNVEIHEGDELNVCLYDIGHTQAVATFDRAQVTVQRNETVHLQLQQHLETPEENQPISDSIITDENGIYLLDSLGRIIKTDSNGEVNISFSEGGFYRVSIMPEINYYMDTSGELTQIEVPRRVERTSAPYINGGMYNLLDPENPDFLDNSVLQAIQLSVLRENGIVPSAPEIKATPTFIFDWDEDAGELITDTWYETVIDTFPVLITDEPKPMITYTPPFANIYVDSAFTLNAELAINKAEGYTTIYIDIKNSDTVEENGVMPSIRVARYNQSGEMVGWVEGASNNDSFTLPKIAGERTGCVAFQFDSYPEDADDDTINDNIYKVFCWKSLEGLEPLCPAITLTVPQ